MEHLDPDPYSEHRSELEFDWSNNMDLSLGVQTQYPAPTGPQLCLRNRILFLFLFYYIQETLSELKKKYKFVTPDECEPHWNAQFKSSAKVGTYHVTRYIEIKYYCLCRYTSSRITVIRGRGVFKYKHCLLPGLISLAIHDTGFVFC
jgi:hypothetical protein